MNNDQRRVIIERILSGYRRPSAQDGSPASPVSRWSIYLMLIPTIALVAVLGVFFFAAFLALFAIVATGLGLRLWWMKRKAQQFKPTSSPTQGRHHVSMDNIEDAQIIDETKIDTKTIHKT